MLDSLMVMVMVHVFHLHSMVNVLAEKLVIVLGFVLDSLKGCELVAELDLELDTQLDVE